MMKMMMNHCHPTTEKGNMKTIRSYFCDDHFQISTTKVGPINLVAMI